MTSYGEARLKGTPQGNLVEDLTTVSGLIVAYGLIIMIGTTVDLAGAAFAGDMSNNWGGTSTSFPPILGLLANLIAAIASIVSVFLGFQYLACRWATKLSALFGLGIILLAWFPFLVVISLIAFQADKMNVGVGGPLLVPGSPTQGEVNAIAVIGILGFWGYTGTVIGALTFLHWKMYRFMAGDGHMYTASYYRSRLAYYGFLTFMVGVLQIALGAYVNELYGWGKLDVPVITAPFFVLYPEISIAVGVVQLLFGALILYRSTTAGVGPSTGNKDGGLFAFQAIAWMVFLISYGAQVMGQVSLFESPAPAIFIGNVVGFAMFPIYLDAMAHTTPENITADMFSTTKTLQSGI